MTSLCLSGQTSAIQKTALLGSEANRKVAIFGSRNTMSREGLGLLDLLKIKFPFEEGINLSMNENRSVIFSIRIIKGNRHSIEKTNFKLQEIMFTANFA